jgi:hypothetical protein
MIYSSDGTPMSISDAEELAAWLIRHMSMEQRVKLMGERPLLYARTFPGVPGFVITKRVQNGLRAQQRQEPEAETETE